MRSQAARAFLWARSRRYFLPGPAHQVGVDARQEHGQRGAVERAVVLHPSAHDRVDHLGELGEAQLGAPVQLPPAHGVAEPFQGLVADRREERGEHLPPRTPGCAGPERVPQEREGRVLVGATPVAVLAVHDPGLVGMQPQPDLGHPVPDRPAQLRALDLRSHCEACRGVTGRVTIEIAHPPGAEVQWDWFERRRAPWGGTAYVLGGTLPHSGGSAGCSPKLWTSPPGRGDGWGVASLGGTARVWRTDRLATVIVPGTGQVQPSFAPVARHYGVVVQPCPPRRGNRKGSVESALPTLAPHV